MLTSEDARARVAKGAAHLDQVRPDWFAHVDPLRLHMGSCHLCVIGQLYGGERAFTPFSIGTDALGWPDYATCEAHGVSADFAADFALLQDAWIAEIARRRYPDAADAAARSGKPSAVDAGSPTRELVGVTTRV